MSACSTEMSEPIQRRTVVFYFCLLLAWGVVVAWQMVEHQRVRAAERAVLINRSRDITTTLGLVIRSQRRFGGTVFQERLESALGELVRSGELSSIALFNSKGEVVASAGDDLNLEARDMNQSGVHWEGGNITVINLVDLGTSSAEGEQDQPTIVLPRRNNDDDHDHEKGKEEEKEEGRKESPPEEHPRRGPPPPPAFPPDNEHQDRQEKSGTSKASQNKENREGDHRWNRDRDRRENDGRGDRDRGFRSPWRGFGRPPWIDEDRYKSLLEKRGMHGVVIAMAADSFYEATLKDLWLRLIIGGFAGAAVVGIGFSWRNFSRSAELQLRLVRASELNAHLKEMNLVAAGLAHETRNPLNIVRGLAQMISKDKNASGEIKKHSREIIDETDRVTAQLVEFINYSRPREIKPSAVCLDTLAQEVSRALSYDLEEHDVELKVETDGLKVEADEQLLRQTLFNLVLNAVQAVGDHGHIQIRAESTQPGEACLVVSDDGPGIAPEHKNDIFRPYFTTHQKGTGLGLAVVKQIVLAHGWEIHFHSNQLHGAVFRIDHLKRLPLKPTHSTSST